MTPLLVGVLVNVSVLPLQTGELAVMFGVVGVGLITTLILPGVDLQLLMVTVAK